MISLKLRKGTVKQKVSNAKECMITCKEEKRTGKKWKGT
jgi:hypothetical protein